MIPKLGTNPRNFELKMPLNLPDSAITSGTDSQKAGTFILKISSKIYFSQLYF